MSEGRLDSELAARGLARSRSHAAELIKAGRVLVDGRVGLKSSLRVGEETRLEVAGDDHYVSRAAHKLIGGLDAFGLDPAGRTALDAGASTGGFTQVLLERGATRVLAVDVGHGQLDPSLREDPRVAVVEGYNLRHAEPATLAAAAGTAAVPELVVGDLSFIALPLVLPALAGVATPEADFVLLIKPQFEVGPTGVREGIVRSAAKREDAVNGVLWAAFDLGLFAVGLHPSPVPGGAGNREYLVHLRRSGGRHPTEWRDLIPDLVGE